MRLALDTNTVVSGLLWGGAPSHLIRAPVVPSDGADSLQALGCREDRDVLIGAEREQVLIA